MSTTAESPSTTIEFSDRLKELPPYLFVEIDKAKRTAKAEGRDIIDLGVGDPDTPTFKHIIEALKKAVDDPANHRYAFDAGLPELRTSISQWFQNRFSINLDPQGEIYPLIGSKEGLAHLPLGIINPKDKVILTDPAYPAYRASIIFAGGKIVNVPLKESQDFLPDLKKIEGLKDIKAMFINYPNNPTSATATKDFYTQLVAIAREKRIILISDMAYSEIYYENNKPVSLLEIEGAKDTTIEFHSFSKTYNMTGWRIGWACGNSLLISALSKVKSNFDSGVFQAIQVAGITALKTDAEELNMLRSMYEERRDCLINGLRNIGWKIPFPKATFYVWAKIPKGFNDSKETARIFLDRANIVVTPGLGFGKAGEGYIRMTLTVLKDRLNEVVDRLQKIL